MPSRSERFSQVFLKDKNLVASLVGRSSIDRGDVVIEIGSGEGIITGELLKKAGKVIAVEKDPILYQELRSEYANEPGVELHKADILRFNLPSDPYKVFSNIPFALESQIIRMLIDHPQNPPTDAYLIMRREVAERLAGQPREGQFSILHQPWFELEIFHNFQRDNFKPKPKVESSMIRFKRREQPLVDLGDKGFYELFIKHGFGGGRRLRQNLSPIFTSNQFKQLAREFRFRESDMPSKLNFNQWMGMFEFLSEKVPGSQRRKFIAKSRR